MTLSPQQSAALNEDMAEAAKMLGQLDRRALLRASREQITNEIIARSVFTIAQVLLAQTIPALPTPPTP